MSGRAIKTWGILLVLVGTPTIWVLLKCSDSEFPLSSGKREILRISNSILSFDVGSGGTATIRADKLSITGEGILFAKGLRIESDSPLIPSLLSIGIQTKSLLASLTQEPGFDVLENVDFPEGREFSRSEYVSWRRYRALGFHDLTIDTPDVQAKVDELRASPGEIGPFKTALYQEIHARGISLSIESAGELHSFQAESAKWKFPFGGINLGKGKTTTSGNQDAFQHCVLKLPAWSVSSIIPQEESAPHCIPRRKYLGLRSKLFSQ